MRIDRQWADKPSPARFGPPKTASSYRTIPASDAVIAELALNVGRRTTGFVLGDTVPLDHNAFRWQWERTRKAAGVAQVRFHDLRHAFASALISGGCSVKAVQKALGHASAGAIHATLTRTCGPVMRTASGLRSTAPSVLLPRTS